MAAAGLPNGVFYDEGEGVGRWRQLRGGSNGQSSLIQFFDHILGIDHTSTGNRSAQKGNSGPAKAAPGEPSFHEEVSPSTQHQRVCGHGSRSVQPKLTQSIPPGPVIHAQSTSQIPCRRVSHGQDPRVCAISTIITSTARASALVPGRDRGVRRLSTSPHADGDAIHRRAVKETKSFPIIIFFFFSICHQPGHNHNQLGAIELRDYSRTHRYGRHGFDSVSQGRS